MKPVVTLGECMGLFRASAVGSIAHVSEFTLGIGGAEGNVAIGLARLGTSVRWLGRVGEDPIGRRVLRELRAEGIDVVGIVDPDAPTGMMVLGAVFIIGHNDSNGENDEDDGDRDVNEKQPAPAECVYEVAFRDRTEGTSQLSESSSDTHRDVSLTAMPEIDGRKRERGGGEQRAAESLNGAKSDQHFGRHGESDCERGGAEEDEPDTEHSPAAE